MSVLQWGLRTEELGLETIHAGSLAHGKCSCRSVLSSVFRKLVLTLQREVVSIVKE
jgi:hypothetical protein